MLVEFTCEAIWSWTFVCRECFYYIFNFIFNDWSIRLIFLFLVQFWQAVFLQYPLRFLLFHFLLCFFFSPFLGESGQRFNNFDYPFKEPALGFIDFFLLFFGALFYWFPLCSLWLPSFCWLQVLFVLHFLIILGGRVNCWLEIFFLSEEGLYCYELPKQEA